MAGGALTRYNRAVQKIPARYPLPGGLPLSQFEEFVERHGDAYKVALTED